MSVIVLVVYVVFVGGIVKLFDVVLGGFIL